MAEESLGARLRAKGVGLGAGTTPTRTRRVDTNKVHYNAYERGTAKDDRGMPYLDDRGNPIGVKRFTDEGWRRKFAERDQRNATQRLTAPPDTQKG